MGNKFEDLIAWQKSRETLKLMLTVFEKIGINGSSNSFSEPVFQSQIILQRDMSETIKNSSFIF
jgi:hypothetical protein